MTVTGVLSGANVSTMEPLTAAPLLKFIVTCGAGTVNGVVLSAAPPLLRLTTNWPLPTADTVHEYCAVEAPEDVASIVTLSQPAAVTAMLGVKLRASLEAGGRSWQKDLVSQHTGLAASASRRPSRSCWPPQAAPSKLGDLSEPRTCCG